MSFEPRTAMSFEPRIVRPEDSGRSPGFILVAVPGTEMSLEMTEAQRVRLREWVPHFVEGHLEYFPPTGTVPGRPLPPPPFPECWEEHPALVQRLRLALLRSEEVAHGDAGGTGPRTGTRFSRSGWYPSSPVSGGSAGTATSTCRRGRRSGSSWWRRPVFPVLPWCVRRLVRRWPQGGGNTSPPGRGWRCHRSAWSSYRRATRAAARFRSARRTSATWRRLPHGASDGHRDGWPTARCCPAEHSSCPPARSLRRRR